MLNIVYRKSLTRNAKNYSWGHSTSSFCSSSFTCLIQGLLLLQLVREYYFIVKKKKKCPFFFSLSFSAIRFVSQGDRRQYNKLTLRRDARSEMQLSLRERQPLFLAYHCESDSLRPSRVFSKVTRLWYSHNFFFIEISCVLTHVWCVCVYFIVADRSIY